MVALLLFFHRWILRNIRNHHWHNTCIRLKRCTTGELWVKVYLEAKRRTAGGETVPQIALRDCSKEAGGKVNIYNLGEGGVQYSQALTLQKVFCWSRGADVTMKEFNLFSRYEAVQGLESWNQFLKISNYLKTCSTSFPGAQSASLCILNSAQGVLKVSSCSSPGFSLRRGRLQMPLSFSQWKMLLASASL